MLAVATDSTLNSGLFSLPFAPADADHLVVRAGPRKAPEPMAEALLAGPENALIRTLGAVAVSQQLPFNPIVIYGQPGVGKSSLAHALAARRRQQYQLAKVIATTGADLARGLADAIDTDSASEFRARHHRCDLLLIDDAQRLAGKQPAQQFLLTAIDALRLHGALVIVTLSQPPQSTPGLLPALASRLAGGLVAGLASPGPLTRLELVRQALAERRLSLDESQIAELAGLNDPVARHFTTPARLRRAVLQFAAAVEFRASGRQASAHYGERDPSASKSVCRTVMASIAGHFGLTIGQLKGKSRRQAVAEARSLAMYIARRVTTASYAELGRHFGGRDHTTVLHACRKVSRALEHDEALRQAVADLTAQIAADEFT